MAFGNIVRGVPIDESATYTGGFFNLLNPYALAAGLTTVALFAALGAIYLSLKTTGVLEERAKAYAKVLGPHRRGPADRGRRR